MEMERINENLIKVMIDAEDLAERGIDFLDLISDQLSIEKFFYSILEEVDIDKHFQESDAVTFQVMPNRNGLELYISRSSFDETDGVFDEQLAKQIINERRKQIIQSKEEAKLEEDPEDQWLSILSLQIFFFEDLEDFILLARELADLDLPADLYHFKNNYYLAIKDADQHLSEDGLYSIFARINEFGERAHITVNTLQEYGQLIRSEDALTYFGQNL
ncbi:adaptor protein MecA [Hutsoniella sourekii]